MISNKGILIETDVPVNATGIHYRAYFSDGSSLLPETVGINDKSLENKLQYKGGILQYSGTTTVDVFVFASNGQLVANDVLQSGSQLDITVLAQGIYTAVIGNGKKRATLRFYLER